jgi:E3 ubiquitin-protein ligase RAD18
MVPVSQEVIALDSDTDGDGDYQPREEEGPRHPNDGLVACPMCNKRMKEEAVYTHLDRCDGQKVKDTPPPMVHQPRPPNPPQQRISSPAKHLPHLNYSLLKDTALKKKLQELGIPTWGNRQLLVRRHTQWVDIFNANSDSPRSKNNRELLKELDVWERTQGGHAPGQGQTAPTGVMRKDFDGTEWTGRHKNQFEDLVTQARAKRKTTTPSTLEDNKQALDYMEGIVRTATASAENSKNDKSTPSSAALSNSDTAPKPMSALLSHELSSSPAASMLHSAAQDVRRRSSISDPSATANIPGLISTHSIPSTSSSTPAPSSHTRVLNDTRFSPTGSPEERKPPMNMATEDSLPEKLGLTTKGTKKISMFRVPEDPINDVELGAGTGGG